MTTTHADTADPIDFLPGEWEGTSSTWFEPDQLADESPIRGRIRRIGSTRFLLHEYESSWGGEARQGVEILGIHLDTPGSPSVSAWVDSFHMGTDIMLSRSAAAPGESSAASASGGLAVLGSYLGDPQNPDSERWGWRTEIELVDRDRVTFTAYNIFPDGQEARATLTSYTRRA